MNSFNSNALSLKSIVTILTVGAFCLTETSFGADGPAATNAAPQAAPAGPGAAAGPGQGPGAGAPRGRGRGRGATATDEDKAEMAKLMDLPAYAINLPDGDYSTGPDYSVPTEENAHDGVPQGKIVEFTMDSSESKFYPGLNGATFQRKVSVYVPSQYKAGTPAPVIVSCDAYGLTRRQLPNILDIEIADHRLPVMVAVMIANGGMAGGERSLEYDTVSSKYTEFVESEVLPRAEKESGVTITKDPDARMTYGGSSGGICAFSMAWFHPELYHRVLSYSGTFVNLQRGPDAPHGGWEYPENFVAKTPAKPLRVWLEVAQNDNGANTASSGLRNWVIANERMAAALKSKGYHYQLVYAKNAGHTEAKAISGTLVEALEYVWRGYPVTGVPAK